MYRLYTYCYQVFILVINLFLCHGIHRHFCVIFLCSIRPVGELQMDLQDVPFLPSESVFMPHFLKVVVVEVKASGPPHVMKPWLGVSHGRG